MTYPSRWPYTLSSPSCNHHVLIPGSRDGVRMLERAGAGKCGGMLELDATGGAIQDSGPKRSRATCL
jgi:hypothetical protein